MERIGIIIVAGGGGHRFGGSRPKQFGILGGVPVLARTIDVFAEALPGAEIVVVLPAEHIGFWHNLASRFDVAPHMVAEGGLERFHSVRCGIAALKSEPELIAVQDGVRPLSAPELIRRITAAAAEHGAAIPVIEPVDSFRETDGASSHVIDRRRLRIVQTPQVFRSELLRSAYATDYRADFTDDASVAEAAGYPVFLCEGDPFNLKITRPEDLALAEALLAIREEQAEQAEQAAAQTSERDRSPESAAEKSASGRAGDSSRKPEETESPKSPGSAGGWH